MCTPHLTRASLDPLESMSQSHFCTALDRESLYFRMAAHDPLKIVHSAVSIWASIKHLVPGAHPSPLPKRRQFVQLFLQGSRL